MRIALVGCGPKGLFALERLLAHAETLRSPLDVDVFEPHPVPGAGQVYDPSQPNHLLMNFSSGQVDMWWRGKGPVTPGPRPTFSEWRADPSDDFATRAEVGRYLKDGLDHVLEKTPSGTRVAFHPRKVDSIDRVGHLWALGAGGEPAGDFDRVLLTTGHEQLRHGSVTADIGAPAAGTVAIRGLSLTFIDAALSLTEGRGGRFLEEPGGSGLSYRGGPDGGLRIAPFSRTGRTMLPKPARTADDDRLEAAATIVIDSLETPLTDLTADLARPLASLLPAELRNRAHGWLKLACTSGVPASDRDDRVLGAELGRVWRAAYPAVVRRLSGTGIVDGQWPAFRRLSAELERVAFGPPPVNAAKLRALVEARVVDLSKPTKPPPAPDAFIDAVMPQPGVPENGILRELVRDGFARIASGRRGLETSEACECIGSDGSPSRGLAAYGRPTEDWVIGNDTLNRTLHPQIDTWASHVVAAELPATAHA